MSNAVTAANAIESGSAEVMLVIGAVLGLLVGLVILRHLKRQLSDQVHAIREGPRTIGGFFSHGAGWHGSPYNPDAGAIHASVERHLRKQQKRGS